MADLKITELNAVATPDDSDLFESVQNVATTPVNRKITWTLIKSFLSDFFDTKYLFTDDNLPVFNDGAVTHVDTLRGVISHALSPFISTGLVISDNGDGTVDITAGEAFLKTTNALDGLLKLVVVPESLALAMTDEVVNTLYIDYNAGTPIIKVRSASIGYFDANWDEVPFATISRHGTTLYITSFVDEGTNAGYKNILATANLMQIRYMFGLAISEPATMKVAVTAGRLYSINTPKDIDAINTNIADTFEYIYQNGAGGWTRSLETDIDKIHYDDGSGTLATIANNKFGNHWVYLVVDTPDQYHIVYGRSEFSTVADAQAEPVPPTLPAELGLFSSSVLVGRIIVKQNGTSFEVIESAFDVTLTPTTPAEHANLSGLDFASSNHTGFAPTRPTTEKTTIVNADEVTGNDSADSFSQIRTTWTNIKIFLLAFFDTVYQELLSGATLTGVTVATDDLVLIQDTSDSKNLKTVTAQSIADLGGGGFDTQFSVYLASNHSATTTDSKINFNSENFDVGGDYDTANQRFTAPATGYYFLSVALAIQADADSIKLLVRKNGSTYVREIIFKPQGSSARIPPIWSELLQLDANDYIEIWCDSDGAQTINGGADQSVWSGFRVA